LKIVMMFSGGLLQMIYVKKFICIIRGGRLFFLFYNFDKRNKNEVFSRQVSCAIIKIAL
jgi:hypothetical protein